jgi:hypothetical protein
LALRGRDSIAFLSTGWGIATSGTISMGMRCWPASAACRILRNRLGSLPRVLFMLSCSDSQQVLKLIHGIASIISTHSSTSKDRDFAVNAFRVDEQAIGEHIDGTPLENPNAGKNPAAVALDSAKDRRSAGLIESKFRTGSLPTLRLKQLDRGRFSLIGDSSGLGIRVRDPPAGPRIGERCGVHGDRSSRLNPIQGK